jgi:hypothetical protein
MNQTMISNQHIVLSSHLSQRCDHTVASIALYCNWMAALLQRPQSQYKHEKQDNQRHIEKNQEYDDEIMLTLLPAHIKQQIT